MRIISGKYKGKRIDVPKSFKARPTTDFAKENLFNILNNFIDFENLHVLDLFAGTGSIGFEFASRDAAAIDCVEIDFRSVKHIQHVATELKLNQIKVYRSDAFRFINNCTKQYNLIFADPPYALKNLGALPDLIFENGLLQPHGLFVLEHGQDLEFTDHSGFKEMRKYGSVHFSMFENIRK
ncbi:MAG: 16S rRNA (guanine(966)-N(2))-methyltransferase RsmD [Bacteroidetes bacterium]|nr:16S rRNA (guanine(966)-N(2))-methyltransferase RsmD [Bacteroidota bacterium]